MTFVETWAGLEAKVPKNVYDLLQTVIYQKNGFFIDIWLFVHFLSGLLLGFITRNPLIVLIILIFFEMFENLYLFPNGLSQPETVSNILTDILVAFAGWFIIRIMLFNSKISIKRF